MSIIKLLLKEIEQEAQITRKMLKIVPEDKYDWKPHQKSMSIRQLTTHIAELPAWISLALTTGGLDFATAPYEPEHISNNAELSSLFERSYAEGRSQLESTSDDKLGEPWIL